jgi:hypothetical protein
MERLYELMQQDVIKAKNMGRTPVLKNVFRKDIFERAKSVMQEESKPEQTGLQSSGEAMMAKP